VKSKWDESQLYTVQTGKVQWAEGRQIPGVESEVLTVRHVEW